MVYCEIWCYMGTRVLQGYIRFRVSKVGGGLKLVAATNIYIYSKANISVTCNSMCFSARPVRQARVTCSVQLCGGCLFAATIH